MIERGETYRSAAASERAAVDSDPEVVEARRRVEEARRELADFDRETEEQAALFDRRAVVEGMKRELSSLIMASVTMPAELWEEAGMEKIKEDIEAGIERLADPETRMSANESEREKERVGSLFEKATAALEEIRAATERQPAPVVDERREEGQGSGERGSLESGLWMEANDAWRGFKDLWERIRVSMTRSERE